MPRIHHETGHNESSFSECGVVNHRSSFQGIASCARLARKGPSQVKRLSSTIYSCRTDIHAHVPSLRILFGLRTFNDATVPLSL